MRVPRALLIGVAAMSMVLGCASEAPETDLRPTTAGTDLVPDTGAPDGGSGNTTPEELIDSCSALTRAFYDALGADGHAVALQPLYDAVTPLLPDEVRADWQMTATAFVAYEDALAQVPLGDDQLAVPEVRAAYDLARSAEVQDALQRVRDAVAAMCPGALD